jgi:prephenate dehydrogenase
MMQRLGIVGLGLIGGSVALAAREQGLCEEIIAFDRCPENLLIATQQKVIDQAAASAAEASKNADLVVIATPVGATEAVLGELASVWSESGCYTDVGSTKCNVIQAAAKIFGAVPANFVAGHPIAGAERSGVMAASAQLYQDRRVILTPVSGNSPQAVRLVEQFWQDIGAQVSLMDAEHHDEVLAATSHLPHVLAFTLVHWLGEKDERQEMFKFAAGGFRDFSRIASSDPLMWRDICLANRARIVPLLQELEGECRRVAEMITGGHAHELHGFFTEAREARQRFLNLQESKR